MTSWSILRFPATDFAAMTKAHFHELFMKGCCVYSSSVKRMFTVNHEQFPMQMTHKHNKWLQILAQEDFSPKVLWSENADFKFSVNNEGEDVNKKPRSRRNIDEHSEGNADNNRQRNRRLESKEL